MKYLKILDGNIPKRKCGAEVVGGAIAAGGSLLGGLISSSSSSSNVSSQLGAQSAENATNRAWQTQEAEKARAFQQGVLNQQNQFSQQMQDRQAYYQSPVYQSEQLRQAGINPAVYFGQQASFGGSSAASVPSAPSPAQVGSVSGLNPVGFQPFGTNIGSILSGIGNVLQSSAYARKLGIESDWLPALLKEQVRNLTKDTELKSILAVCQQIHNELEKANIPYALKQAEANLYKTLSEIDLNSQQVLTEISKQQLNRAIEGVQNALKDLTEKEAQQAGLELPYVVQLIKAKLSDLSASASEHNASARLKVSEADAQDMANTVRSAGLNDEMDATISKWISESTLSSAKRQEAYNQLQILRTIGSANDNSDNLRKVNAALQSLFDLLGLHVSLSNSVHN